jgi:hypothetical protein
MVRYSELELKYARPIADAILGSRDFRRWLFSGTKYGALDCDFVPAGPLQAALRSPTMKNPYWFNYWCGRDARCACRIGTGIETDMLFILSLPGGTQTALHIELKRPHEHLGEGQAESYPRRAACWSDKMSRPKTVLPHNEFITMLVCGSELASDPRTNHFDKVVVHEQLAKLIQPYPEL